MFATVQSLYQILANLSAQNPEYSDLFYQSRLLVDILQGAILNVKKIKHCNHWKLFQGQVSKDQLQYFIEHTFTGSMLEISLSNPFHH